MLRVLGRPNSINVRKVLWLCEELGAEHVLEPWGAGVRSTDAPEFLALNPNALVPVLVDTGVDPAFTLWESNTICRYLAASHGRTDLLPAAPGERARVEQWMDWQAAELNRAWSCAFLALVRKSPAHPDPAAIAASEAAWNRHMAILDRHLQDADESSFTLADIVLGLSTHRWYATPIERPSLPAVAAFYERLCRRPAFQRHGPQAGP